MSAALILFLAFENPVRYLDWRGGAFNIRAFREALDDRIGIKPFRILLFAIQEYGELREMYGVTQMDQGVTLICRHLCGSYSDCQVFYLRNGRFALLGSEAMDWDGMRQELSERFKAPWLSDAAELDLSILFVQTDSKSVTGPSDRVLDSLYLAFDNADAADYPPGSLVELARREELWSSTAFPSSLSIWRLPSRPFRTSPAWISRSGSALAGLLLFTGRLRQRLFQSRPGKALSVQQHQAGYVDCLGLYPRPGRAAARLRSGI